MLQFIRDRAQGVIVWIIISLIIVVFALFGLGDYITTNPTVLVAEVDDAEITASEFKREYAQQKQRLKSMLGERYDDSLFDNNEQRNSLLDALIERTLIVKAANDLGYKVSKGQLNNEIQKQEQFQTDGVFDQSHYLSLLEGAQLSVSGFEEQFQRGLLIDQFRNSIQNTAFITNKELAEIVRLVDQKRKIQYMVISASDYKKEVSLLDDELQAYYDDHKAEYSIPQQVSLEYIELSTAGLAAKVEDIDEEELKKEYEDNLSRFGKEEERKASHILIQVDEDASDDAIEAAKTKAEGLLARIKAGESLGDLAKEHSDDPGSAEKMGDLGYFGKGMMVKPFEEAVYALEVDAVSELVRSNFGFHIIQLTDIKSGETKPFAEVKGILEQEYRERKAEDQFYELSEQLVSLAFEHPESLDMASENLGLDIKTTEAFSEKAGGQGITANPKVIKAAFSTEVLEEGNNSEPVELSADHIMILRVKEKIPSRYQPLSDVKAEIKTAMTNEKAMSQAKSLGDEVLAALEKGEAADEVAKKYHKTWSETDLLTRQERPVDDAIVTKGFKLPAPTDEGKLSWGTVSLINGDYVVLAVKELKQGDITSYDEARKSSLERQSRNSAATAELDAVIAGLEKRASIRRFPENF